MMARNILCLLPMLASTGAVAAPRATRVIVTGQTIYAYGEGILGYPVYANAEGLAVIAPNGTDTSSLFALSWDIDTTGAAAWNVSLNATQSSASFYIIPDGEDYIPAGFTINGTVPDGAATEGFVLYGNDIEFMSDNTYLYQFWAKNTSDGLFSIVWNTQGTAEDGAVPIYLKPTAPSADREKVRKSSL